VTIYLKDLTFHAIIGILEFERITPQKIVINLSLEYEYQKNRYINYALIAQELEDIMQKSKFELIEDALLTLKEHLLNKYPTISKLSLEIAKPDILDNATVSVAISWEKEH